MARIFCVAVMRIGLAGLFYVGALHGMNASVAALKSDLNAEFGWQAGDDMFVITVTRAPVSSGFIPLISHNEFEQVLKLLYASCVDPGCWLTRWWRGSEAAISPPYSRQGVVLNNAVDLPFDISGGLSAKAVSAINSVRQDIGRYFLGNNMQNACKLVVFNEMFFSQLEPLSIDQKNFIEGKIFDLSRSASSTVFYPNFLYVETRNVPGSDVYNDLIRMGTNAGTDGLRAIGRFVPTGGAVAAPNPSMFFNNARRSLGGCAAKVNRQNVPNNGTLVNWDYLVNETYAINNGKVLTRYKKVGYFRESDEEIRGGALYDSGPGHDEAVLVGASTLRDKLLRNVSTDVCLDLALGVRRTGVHQWANPSGVPVGDSRLHLVQSNSIDPFCDSTNRGNLPRGRGILHADAYPYPSWSIPVTGRPQNIYLPYVDVISGLIEDDFLGCRNEFHLRIVESDYRFSFLRI